MGYRELIKKVQIYSGFSDSESKEALDCMVETLAIHLNEGERKDFASQLPQELQDMALAVMPTKQTAGQDIFEQFMENQKVEEPRAKKTNDGRLERPQRRFVTRRAGTYPGTTS